MIKKIFLLTFVILAACSPEAEVAPPITVVTATAPRAINTSAPISTQPPVVPTATQPPAALTTQAASYPSPTQQNIGAAYEPFERGFMIYLSDRKQIWVFIRASLTNTPANSQANFGQWLAYPDTFQDGQPETDPTFVAPARLLQPKRGFGKVWRENAAVRNGIGWGSDWEQSYNTNAATYPIGTLDGGKFNQKFSFHLITALDGSLLYINEATFTWSKQ